ncbi:hypothetical protein [Streptomyces mayonensis]|uniref:hypothetical protein n=1 Tax=Streptomyces mayonensis TaxID=2750816 RepID=UPI001C1DCFB0|nr:hypothetical protein [Streptomyces sp. A108]MBU6530820.1 hypothetical protein [Streptomyces sp. A108]
MSEETRPQARPVPTSPAGVSMRDLLVACAAATAVSTPPRAPEPQTPPACRPVEQRHHHREAA